MKTAVRIIDNGGTPKIEGTRLTVMDVFYYLHRGRDFDYIHRAMPKLTRDEFDAVVEFVRIHRDRLVEMDDQIEERNRREMAEQEAKGIRRPIDESIPLAERIARLRAVMERQTAERAEKTRDHVAD